MEPVCFLNGSIIPLSEAKIGILDLGLLRAFGIYEGIAAFAGMPFRYEDHWKRFERSAERLGLSIPVSSETALEAMRAIIAHNAPGQRANLRMVLTGGVAEGGIEHVPGRETFFITAEPATPLPAALYERGASLITHEHERLLPESKTVDYTNAVMLQKLRREKGAVEILYVSKGRVLECATSNIFIVKSGELRTSDSGVLKGVTRNVVFELAQGAHSAREASISTDELFSADEVFITSSFKDIVPIVSIDDTEVGGGAPGPVTKDLMRRFAEYTLK
jgi:branched-subunit amino acid aminotransferase/4-amino-4-deoxychorismate lyase